MNDKAVKIFTNDNCLIPKVKGHTRIELTSVKTGKKKVFEHSNVFQSAILAKYLRALSAADNNPFANNTWAARPLWRNLCGGIFLFRDAIDTSNGDVEYMPAGNLMVANGAYGVVNNGNPPELGSYNSIESSTSGANSLSFVYDWGTSQGNGTIGCICLTSETGGYVGYGNSSGYRASGINLLRNQETKANNAKLYYNGKQYRIISVDYTNKKVTVGTQNDMLTNASIFQGQNEVVTEHTYTGTPIGSGTTNTYAQAISETEIAIFRSSTADTIGNNESAGILVVDVSTMTASVKTITNTSGEALNFYINGIGIACSKDANGNYYLPSNSGLNKFNSSGVFVERFTGLGGNQATAGQITPELLGAQATANAGLSIIDGSNARPTNGSINVGNGNRFLHITTLDSIAFSNNSEAGSYISPYKNPLYLATINNLGTAIVKDNTQTMKVIYTLTEA